MKTYHKNSIVFDKAIRGGGFPKYIEKSDGLFSNKRAFALDCEHIIVNDVSSLLENPENGGNFPTKNCKEQTYFRKLWSFL